MTRRTLILTPALLTSCAAAPDRSDGALRARPQQTRGATKPGTHSLGIREKRDALLSIPKNLASKYLVLYLHGAGGSEEQGPRRLGGLSEKLGFPLLSPASESRTWDAIRDGFGPDVPMIDAALRKAFTMVQVDRVIVAGFSDGASYALGLGLRNAELFHTIAAFSPGFIAGSGSSQKNRIFISHGTDDEILPIDSCSRRLVPKLKRDGHTVNYREFAGPHTVPAEIAEEGLRWAMQPL